MRSGWENSAKAVKGKIFAAIRFYNCHFKKPAQHKSELSSVSVQSRKYDKNYVADLQL
jgi:hypothetical protein